jgi:hypothetical protein
MQNNILIEKPSSIIGQWLSCLLDESQSKPVVNSRLRHPLFKLFICMPMEHFFHDYKLLNALSNLKQPLQLLKQKLRQEIEIILNFGQQQPNLHRVKSYFQCDCWSQNNHRTRNDVVGKMSQENGK